MNAQPGQAVPGPFGIVVDDLGIFTSSPDGLGTIWRTPLDGGDPVVFAQLGGDPRAMTEEDTALYVAGGCTGTIWRVPLAGGPPIVVAQASSTPACIRGISGGFYTSGGTPGVFDLPGGAPPQAIAGGAEGCTGSVVGWGDVAWIDTCAGHAALQQLSHGALSTIDPGQASGDAIATDANAIYWAADGFIKRRALGSNTNTDLAPIDAGETVYGIASDGTDVYWSTSTSLMRVPVIGGTPELVTHVLGPAGVALHDTHVYWGGGGACPPGRMPK